ncbi:MAG: DUF3710 domain-containing protein [Micromonosporaceae bacterium]
MSFFRRRKPGRHAEDGDIFAQPDVAEPEDDEEALEGYVEGLSAEEKKWDGGPYDIDELDSDDDVNRLDLGSLKIPSIDGVEIQMKGVHEQHVEAVLLVDGDSVLQVSAFAAPRSEAVWDDVRGELRQSIQSQGGVVEEADGPFGLELRAKIRTPNGPTAVRFVGVDGPRWFVKAVFQGRIGADPHASKPLHQAFTELVVDRGKEARPVHELLPLTLPDELAEQLAEQARRQTEASAAEEQADPAATSNGSTGRAGKRSGRR